MTVGEKIQKYRKDLDLSQEELGQKLLVSRQTINQPSLHPLFLSRFI